MRIDRTHRPWVVATVALAIVSTAAYILYAVETPGGPRGGSAIGLTFGIVGYGLMLFAGLLGARKRVPTWRIGRAQTWMRGHLWLGLLSLLLILYHAGFAFRGPLTLVMMLLFFIVIGSGILGAAIQHYVPSFMTARVPLETIYEEIPHVRAQLCDEADQLAAADLRTVRTVRPACWWKSSTTIANASAKSTCRRCGRIWRIRKFLVPSWPIRCAPPKRLKPCAACWRRPSTACSTILKTSARKSSN